MRVCKISVYQGKKGRCRGRGGDPIRWIPWMCPRICVLFSASWFELKWRMNWIFFNLWNYSRLCGWMKSISSTGVELETTKFIELWCKRIDGMEKIVKLLLYSTNVDQFSGKKWLKYLEGAIFIINLICKYLTLKLPLQLLFEIVWNLNV